MWVQFASMAVVLPQADLALVTCRTAAELYACGCISYRIRYSFITKRFIEEECFKLYKYIPEAGMVQV